MFDLNIIESAYEFKVKTLFKFLAAGGTYVSKEVAEKRIAICVTCPKYGKVKPLDNLPSMKGCTECGCPTATKPHMKTLPRPANKMGKTLNLAELLELKHTYDPDSIKYEDEIIICPHPDGNKWELIDNNF